MNIKNTKNKHLANHKKKKEKNEKSNIESKQDFQKLNNTYKNYHKIFTDASKTKHGIVTAPLKKQRLSNHTSILITETDAILEALRYIQENKYQSVVIYTDTSTSINAITNTNTTKKHEVIQMVQETYTELTNDHKQIIITRIPSHQGIGGNEKGRLLSQRSNNKPNKRSQRSNPTPRPTSFNDQS